MAEVKAEIERLRKENKEFDGELRRLCESSSEMSVIRSYLCPGNNGQADHKARRLAAKISENQILVEQLRQERDALTQGHTDLQTRYAKISEVSYLISYVLHCAS